jgi:hypothetical protein
MPDVKNYRAKYAGNQGASKYVGDAATLVKKG